MIKVCFDLDGTLFDLYGKSNWLELLETESAGAFIGDFLPEINVTELLNVVEKLKAFGVVFEVITWLPKNATKAYEEICTAEKMAWCSENLPFVSKVVCQSYGIPKQKAITKSAKTMILIDDNKEVCTMWETAKQRKSINVNKTYTVVNALQSVLTALEGGA